MDGAPQARTQNRETTPCKVEYGPTRICFYPSVVWGGSERKNAMTWLSFCWPSPAADASKEYLVGSLMSPLCWLARSTARPDPSQTIGALARFPDFPDICRHTILKHSAHADPAQDEFINTWRSRPVRSASAVPRRRLQVHPAQELVRSFAGSPCPWCWPTRKTCRAKNGEIGLRLFKGAIMARGQNNKPFPRHVRLPKLVRPA